MEEWPVKEKGLRPHTNHDGVFFIFKYFFDLDHFLLGNFLKFPYSLIHSKKHIFSVCCVPGRVHATMAADIVLSAFFNRSCFYPHFLDRKTKAQN